MSGFDIKNQDIKKATQHVNQNEGLIFERSSPGKKGYRLAPLDVPEVDYTKALGTVSARRPRQYAGGERDGDHPPLYAAFHVELRD